MLVVFRILQGVGGGGLQPSEQAILNDTFPISKRGMAFAVYGIAVVVAPTIGPWLGGWITDNYSWRWIFYINVPVGIISLTLTYFLVSDPPYMKRVNLNEGFRVDYIGLGLISLGLGSMQIILDKGQREDWFSSELYPFLCRHHVDWGHRRHYLGIARQRPGRRFPHARRIATLLSPPPPCFSSGSCCTPARC